MPEAFTRTAPRTLADWRQLWSFTLDPYRTVRRRTREVRVGSVGIGGDNPVRLQSMTIADTLDTAAVVEEITALAHAGSEIVRVTAPNRSAAENLGPIRQALRQRGVQVPLVADVHFTPQAALIAAEHVDKVRINPGNYADRKHFKRWEYTDTEYAAELERLEAAFRPLVLRCKERGVAMRIGTNHGSLSDRILNRYGDTPEGMVESALEFVRICEQHGYRDLVLSMKASDVKVMIAAYRLLAQRQEALGMNYPLHLGVTEAGAGMAARVKSAIGIATLLADGLGDTIRVSLTEDSVFELPVARALAAPFQSTRRETLPLATTQTPPWDPYFYTRRAVQPLGRGSTRLASDQPPRLELVVETGADTDLEARLTACTGADLVLLAPKETSAAMWASLERRRAALPRGLPGCGLEIPAASLLEPSLAQALDGTGWERLSLRFDAFDPRIPPILAALPSRPAVQCTASAEVLLRLATAVADALLPEVALALQPAGTAAATLHAWRALLAAWPAATPALPLVLRGPILAAEQAVDAHVSQAALQTAWELGGLVADGIGDAIQLAAGPGALDLAREILQATRARLSKADFIACPSCGRTQFDLQSTTARIESRLRHLRGLKIAVMGCIVNGPGEMADADFGYVGSGPGKIDLYVGHERVERNVPEAEAVSRLVELIRRHGRWVEPGAAGGTE